MAYEYDRFEREDGGSSFLMGLLAGTVLGAGLGMLFAPKTGSELRHQLGESATRLRTSAGDTYGQASEKVSGHDVHRDERRGIDLGDRRLLGHQPRLAGVAREERSAPPASFLSLRLGGLAASLRPGRPRDMITE
jgi:hypothetical protein